MVDDAMRERCDTCRFWVREYGYADKKAHVDDKEGTCHRRSPSATLGDYESQVLKLLSIIAEYEDYDWDAPPSMVSYWPTTTGHSWCGDYVKGEPRTWGDDLDE